MSQYVVDFQKFIRQGSQA